MDPIVSPFPEKRIISSRETDIAKDFLNEEQVIEVPHIDFIFGDKLSFLEDCDPLIQVNN